MPLLKDKGTESLYQGTQKKLQHTWNELEDMTRTNLHQEFQNISEVDQFLEEEYDPFIRDYLDEHGLETSLIPEDMSIQYDPSGELTKGGRAIHYPQHVVLGPEVADERQMLSEEQPLTSCIGEEYIHEFGSNYFANVEPFTRIEIEEAITKQWQIFCEDDMYDRNGRQETLDEAEFWYNNSPSYLPNAGTRIKDMTKGYLQHFDNNNLTPKEHVQEVLSNPDIIADDYLNTYTTASTGHSPGQSYRQQ